MSEKEINDVVVEEFVEYAKVVGEGKCPTCKIGKLITNEQGEVVCPNCIINQMLPCNLKQAFTQLQILGKRMGIYFRAKKIPAFGPNVVYNCIPLSMLKNRESNSPDDRAEAIDALYRDIKANRSNYSNRERKVVEMAMELKVAIQDTINAGKAVAAMEEEAIAQGIVPVEVVTSGLSQVEDDGFVEDCNPEHTVGISHMRG